MPEFETSDPPANWGEDPLTLFIDKQRNNQFATFANKAEETKQLIAIDDLFRRPSEQDSNASAIVSTLLMQRCHVIFHAAAGLAMAGHGPEVFILCRSMLEFAGYAVHIHRNPGFAEVWFDRNESDKEKQNSKNHFHHWQVLNSVKSANVHAAERFENLYEQTIDMGAHPNQMSVTGNIEMSKQGDQTVYSSTGLHGDGVQLDYGLRIVLRCGLVSLELFQVPLNARFEILGINAAMLELRRVLL